MLYSWNRHITYRDDFLSLLTSSGPFGPKCAKFRFSESENFGTLSMTGHMLGGAGGIEAAFVALTLRNGIIPPTVNLENPDPDCDLDYVPNVAREQSINTAMSNSFGFGGTNGVIIMKSFKK